MPIYEYHCDACNHDFEEWHQHADDILSVPCPECREEVHRVISNTSFVLKGGGWYVTEYGGRKADGVSSGSAKTDGGSATAAPETASAGSTGAEKATPPPAPKAETAAAPAASS